MRRTALVFLAGLGSGIALGFAGSAWLRPQGAPQTAPAGGTPAAEAGPAASQGSPASLARTAPSMTDVVPVDTGASLAKYAIDQLTLGKPGAREIALAQVLIRQQRWGEALAAIDAALAARVDSALLHAAVESLPQEQLMRLLASHPGAFAVRDEVLWLHHAGAHEEALQAAERDHRPGEQLDVDMWRILLSSRRDRALADLDRWGVSGSPGIALTVANALEAAGRTHEALSRLRTIAGRRTLWSQEIDWLLERDRGAALEAAKAVTAARPDSAGGWEQQAQILEAAGDKEGAFAAYERALRLGAQVEAVGDKVLRLDPARALGLFQDLYGSHSNPAGTLALARACMLAGRTGEAGSHLLSYAGAVDDDEYLKYAARVAPDVALPALVAMVPRIEISEEASALEAYGSALRATGRREEAFRAFSRLLELPGGRQCPVFQGLLEADPAKALPLVEPFFDDPNFPALRIEAYGRAGRKAEALTAFDRRIGPPDLFGPWVALAYTDPDRAVAHLRELVAGVEAQGVEARDEWRAVGQALAAAGRTAAARAAYDRALATGLMNLDWEIERASLR